MDEDDEKPSAEGLELSKAMDTIRALEEIVADLSRQRSALETQLAEEADEHERALAEERTAHEATRQKLAEAEKTLAALAEATQSGEDESKSDDKQDPTP